MVVRGGLSKTLQGVFVCEAIESMVCVMLYWSKNNGREGYMIKRMLTLAIITVIMTPIMIMTACDFRCERSLYSEGVGVDGCPDEWFRCCNTDNDEDCEEGGTGMGHWTCCNNVDCQQ